MSPADFGKKETLRQINRNVQSVPRLITARLIAGFVRHETLMEARQ